MLKQYTVEELAYEYYIHAERDKASKEALEQKADKIEEAKLQEAEIWADMMEREELEQMQQAQSKSNPDPDPMSDPENEKWAKEEIEKNKLFFDEDFGEDLNIDFEE